MVKEKLRYKKINEFIEDLNTREQKYIIKKLQESILDKEVENVDCTFVINGNFVK